MTKKLSIRYVGEQGMLPQARVRSRLKRLRYCVREATESVELLERAISACRHRPAPSVKRELALQRAVLNTLLREFTRAIAHARPKSWRIEV
jgi:hypothetical protein